MPLYVTAQTPALADVLAEGNDAAAGPIVNLADPSNDQDAATKAYVDSTGVTLPIAESDVTGLVDDLAAKAPYPLVLTGVQIPETDSPSTDGLVTASGNNDMGFAGAAGTFLLTDGTTFHHIGHGWSPNPGSGTDRYLSVWIAHGPDDGGSTPAGAGYEMNEGTSPGGGWLGYVLLAWILVPATATRSDQCTVIDKRTLLYGPGSTLPIAQSDVTDLVADLAAKLTSPIAESDVAGLTADLASKLSSPIAESDVTNLVADLAAKVPAPIPTSPPNGTLDIPGVNGGAYGPADSFGQFETFVPGVVIRITVTVDISPGVGVVNGNGSYNQAQAYNPTPAGVYDFTLGPADTYDFYGYPGNGTATGAGTWEVLSDGSSATAGQALLAAESGAATTRWGDVASLPIAQADVTGLVAGLASKYAPGGTDVAVTDGGTGASTAADARNNLGLGTAAVAATGDFDAAGAASGAVSTHAGLADPHPGYLTPAEGTAAYDAIGAATSAVSVHTGDASDAHDASAVSVVPAGSIAATDVQAALEELDAEKSASAHTHTHAATTGQTANDHHAQDHAARHADGGADEISIAGLAGTSVELAAHLAAADAHDASAISFAPTGTIAATDVQAAIAEVAAEASGASFATPAIVLGTAAAAGAASTVIRSDSTIAAFDATAPVIQAFDDVASAGDVAFAARRNHRHGMPSAGAGAGNNAADNLYLIANYR